MASGSRISEISQTSSSRSPLGLLKGKNDTFLVIWHEFLKNHNFMIGIDFSIRNQITMGERSGQKVRRLGTMADCFFEDADLTGDRCANLSCR